MIFQTLKIQIKYKYESISKILFAFMFFFLQKFKKAANIQDGTMLFSLTLCQQRF
jgi:hypothetical protein